MRRGSQKTWAEPQQSKWTQEGGAGVVVVVGRVWSGVEKEGGEGVITALLFQYKKDIFLCTRRGSERSERLIKISIDQRSALVSADANLAATYVTTTSDCNH